MSTPNKRRKTDAYKSPQKAVGSLDFFFKKSQNANGKVPNSAVDEPTSTKKTINSEDETPLTDEAFARQLQAQWDREEDSLDTLPRQKHADTPSSKVIEQNDGSVEGEKELKPAINNHEPDEQTQKATIFNASEQKTTLALQSTAQSEDTVSSTVPFDENPLTFNPQKYFPNLQHYWATLGGQSSYGILIRCFTLVNSTQSRIKIVDTLVNFLRTIIEGDPQSLLSAVSYSIRLLLLWLTSSRSGWLPMPYHHPIFRWSLDLVVLLSRRP